MSEAATAAYIAKTLAVWPQLSKRNQDRLLAELRLNALRNCGASRKALEALGEPDLFGALDAAFRPRDKETA